jgi:hypothetical protein
VISGFFLNPQNDDWVPSRLFSSFSSEHNLPMHNGRAPVNLQNLTGHVIADNFSYSDQNKWPCTWYMPDASIGRCVSVTGPLLAKVHF